MDFPLKAYLAFQNKEVSLEHKYYLSEKVGYDIGIEQTYFDWTNTSRAQEFREKYKNNIKEIIKYCNNKCGDISKCGGLEKCIASLEDIHKLLND